MKKTFSLKTTAEFQAVFQKRCSASDGLLIVYVLGAEHDGHDNGHRLGLSVSKRYGCAVRRVRWKRLVRAAFRQVCADSELFEGFSFDMVVVPGRTRRADAMADFENSFKKLVPVVVKKWKRGIIAPNIEKES